MVVMADSFVIAPNKVVADFKPKTNADIAKLLPTSNTKTDAPKKPSDADIAKVKTGAAKRT